MTERRQGFQGASRESKRKKANKTLVATGDNVLLEFELPFRRCHSYTFALTQMSKILTKPFQKETFTEVLGWLDQFSGDERYMIILGSARIDTCLERLLVRRLPVKPKGQDTLLGPDRPLGSFSARIALSYRLGMLDADFESMLQTIRKIRNDVAHSHSKPDLDLPPYSDRLEHLRSLAARSPLWNGVMQRVREILPDYIEIPERSAHSTLLLSFLIVVLSLEGYADAIDEIDCSPLSITTLK